MITSFKTSMKKGIAFWAATASEKTSFQSFSERKLEIRGRTSRKGITQIEPCKENEVITNKIRAQIRGEACEKQQGLFKTYRSSHRRCSIKKGVPKKFRKIYRKTLVPECLLCHLSLRPATLLKKRPGTDVFLWILRNLQEHLFYRTLGDFFWKK